jgi:hypothetical protein
METVAAISKKVLFEEELSITGITEYGFSWEDMRSGDKAIPLEGARFDLNFEGFARGQGINGKIIGTDYMNIRADGRFLLTIYGRITTDDGVNIAFYEDGILTPSEDDPGKAGLRLNMRLNTADPRYSWVNKLQVWCVGTADTENRKVKVRAYSE